MIQTVRDAEQHINDLERKFDTLKLQIQQMKNEVIALKKLGEERNSTPVSTNNEIDSIRSGDGGSVLHNLLHIFKRIKTEKLEADTFTTATVTATDVNATNVNATNGNFTTVTATGNITVVNVTASDTVKANKVGIGGITPSQALDVNGFVRIRHTPGAGSLTILDGLSGNNRAAVGMKENSETMYRIYSYQKAADVLAVELSTGNLVITANNTPPSGAIQPASSVCWFLDQAQNRLNAQIKFSDGSVHYAVITLL